jgi:hypothetical protein
MIFTFTAPEELQLYERINMSHVLKKRLEKLRAGHSMEIERVMFGTFFRQDVVALETPQPRRAGRSQTQEHSRLVLVHDMGLDTQRLIEHYKAYVSDKSEESKPDFSTAWAELSVGIGKSFQLTPSQRRLFEGNRGTIFFGKLVELRFPSV